MPATRFRTSSADVAAEVKESPEKELKTAEPEVEKVDSYSLGTSCSTSVEFIEVIKAMQDVTKLVSGVKNHNAENAEERMPFSDIYNYLMDNAENPTMEQMQVALEQMKLMTELMKLLVEEKDKKIQRLKIIASNLNKKTS